MEYFSGIRIPINPLLRLANAATNFCGALLPFTWVVYDLTVFREEREEQTMKRGHELGATLSSWRPRLSARSR